MRLDSPKNQSGARCGGGRDVLSCLALLRHGHERLAAMRHPERMKRLKRDTRGRCQRTRSGSIARESSETLAGPSAARASAARRALPGGPVAIHFLGETDVDRVRTAAPLVLRRDLFTLDR